MWIKKYKIIIFILSFISFSSSFGQEDEMREKEKQLIQLTELILNGGNDSIKRTSNNEFKKNLIDLLNMKKSYSYKFSEIQNLNILYPKDKKFKLFSWFVPYTTEAYTYHLIIQTCNKRGRKCKIYNLTSKKSLETETLNKILNHKQWYGCLYYEIIPIKVNKKKYYTLLGWDNNTSITTKKIIEVIKFEKKKDPIFGADIFNNNQKRILIEYSSDYSVSLQYDDKLNYIVYDHLEPIDEISTNNFSIYVPNLSYDVFKKTDFGWKQEKNIYLNNKK